MKKIILIVLFALGLSTHNASAQALNIQHDTAIGVYTGFGFVNVHNLITTTSSSPVLLDWNVVSHNLPASWMDINLGICDNVACWGSNIFSSGSTQTDTVKNNKSIDLKLIVNPGSDNGSYHVVVNVRDQGGTVNKNIVYIVNKWPANVVNISKSEEEVFLYPNPATTNLNVVFNSSLKVKNVAIYNLIGKPVKVYKVNGNSAKLDINDIPFGIYFVRLINANGQIVATRKFTHQ